MFELLRLRAMILREEDINEKERELRICHVL
jgi:hypothetical protein